MTVTEALRKCIEHIEAHNDPEKPMPNELLQQANLAIDNHDFDVRRAAYELEDIENIASIARERVKSL